LVQDLDEAI
jgi:hypothetical protein